MVGWQPLSTTSLVSRLTQPPRTTNVYLYTFLDVQMVGLEALARQRPRGVLAAKHRG